MPTMLIRHHAMYYQDIGKGFPILFGHGYLWDRKMWQPQVERLSKHFRCIVPDLWSHGFSEEIPQRPYSIEQLSDDYFFLMRYLGFSEYGVVGFSVGGMWATQLALNHPELVKALVLMDTFVGEEGNAQKSYYNELLAEIDTKEQFSDELVQALCQIFFSSHTLNSNPSLVQSFKSYLKQIPHERLAGIIEMGYTIFNRGSLLGQLKQLQIPVLVACGQEDKPRPLSESRQMLEYIPKAEFVEIPNAGHVATLEQPELVSDILEDFLCRHFHTHQQDARQALA